MKNMGYGIRDSVKAAAAVLCLVNAALLAILLIGIGRCIFQYTKEFTFDKISSTIATDMRRDLFAHIQSLSADFFDKTSTGELMARVKDDIDRIWNALGYVGMLKQDLYNPMRDKDELE